jgi:hypothetical protein
MKKRTDRGGIHVILTKTSNEGINTIDVSVDLLEDFNYFRIRRNFGKSVY